MKDFLDRSIRVLDALIFFFAMISGIFMAFLLLIVVWDVPKYLIVVPFALMQIRVIWRFWDWVIDAMFSPKPIWWKARD